MCGRLCFALCELSPHLQKCIIGSSDKNKDGAKVFKRQHSKLSRRQQDDPKFVEVKKKLIDQSTAAYRQVTLEIGFARCHLFIVLVYWSLTRNGAIIIVLLADPLVLAAGGIIRCFIRQ